MQRRYISSVTPLDGHVLQIDYVSGSRVMLDMTPLLESIRFLAVLLQPFMPETAEKILVGIGSEWKKKEGTEEEEVLHAAEKLKNFLDGKDYYIITSLSGEDADRLGFSAGHMAVPHSVSFTEEAWKHYTLWLSCTLNRNTVLLELGENYKDPSLIRRFDSHEQFDQRGLPAAVRSGNHQHLARLHLKGYIIYNRSFLSLFRHRKGKMFCTQHKSVSFFQNLETTNLSYHVP